MPSVYQLFMPNNAQFITIKAKLQVKAESDIKMEMFRAIAFSVFTGLFINQ